MTRHETLREAIATLPTNSATARIELIQETHDRIASYVQLIQIRQIMDLARFDIDGDLFRRWVDDDGGAAHVADTDERMKAKLSRLDGVDPDGPWSWSAMDYDEFLNLYKQTEPNETKGN